MQNGRGRPERSETSGAQRVDTLGGGARLQIYKSTHPQYNPQKPFRFNYCLLQVTLDLNAGKEFMASLSMCLPAVHLTSHVT